MAVGRKKVKNLTVPIAVAIGIVGCVLAASANLTASKLHESLEQERYKRIVAEEQVQTTKNTVKTLESDLADSKGKLASIEDILKSNKTAMENQMEKIAKERDALKQQLQTVQPPAASTDEGKKP